MIAVEARGIGMEKRKDMDRSLLWISSKVAPEVLSLALQRDYSGVIFHPDNIDAMGMISSRVRKILVVETPAEAERLPKLDASIVIASRNRELLSRFPNHPTALRCSVDDADGLHAAIDMGRRHDYVIMSFKDPTNIPLELVIASLQSSNTILIKEIADDQMDDAVVVLGVMEVGAEGVLFSPKTVYELEQFLQRIPSEKSILPLKVGTVKRAVPVGMGLRSCLDLATLFQPTEGILVGSTSQGGILCCPEVFHLPYMELRPFRVNAGAIHSYVFNSGNRTNYMSELRAGSPMMVVDASGKSRQAFLGRSKIECRPLRLIEVEFEDQKQVNLILQDDWHVRIYSEDVKPLNITELRPGTKVLGHVSDPGRHVGIKVSETILEY